MAGADFPGWCTFLSSLVGALLWPLLFDADTHAAAPQRHDPDAV